MQVIENFAFSYYLQYIFSSKGWMRLIKSHLYDGKSLLTNVKPLTAFMLIRLWWDSDVTNILDKGHPIRPMERRKTMVQVEHSGKESRKSTQEKSTQDTLNLTLLRVMSQETGKPNESEPPMKNARAAMSGDAFANNSHELFWAGRPVLHQVTLRIWLKCLRQFSNTKQKN